MVFVVAAVAATAQQTRPDDNVARPVLQYGAEETIANPKLPTVFVVGDSTSRNGKDLGWGDHFAHYFDLTRVNVANRARGGRSSRTFIHEGAWDKVLAEMKAGDFVLIQMGHNDGGPIEGPKSRASLKGIGNEQQEIVLADGTHEVVHTFGWYLRKYIADSRAKGATPILLTTTVRNIWINGKIERDMGYGAAVTAVAAAEHVALADMGKIAADGFEGMGPDKTALMFPIDHTHTSAAGAEFNAQAVVAALREIKSPVAKYLKDAD